MELLIRAAALDAASEGIALTGPDGRYTYINPSHLSLFGYREAAEVLGKSWHIFYTPEEIDFIEKSVFPELLEKKIWRGRVRGHRKDRSSFVQELSLSLLPDGGIACTCSDATERIEAIEQRERLFSVSKSLLVIYDFEGNIKQFNPAWTDLLGYSRKEFLSRPILSHVCPEDRAATAAAMDDLRFGIPVVNFTNRFLASDGRLLTLDWSSTSSVERGLVFASAHNITKRRVVEQSLKESEDNFRAFFETIDDMIFVGSPDGQILFSNRAASRKLGYSPEELRTMLLIDLHPPELRQKAGEIVGAMLRGERETCPLPLEKKSGSHLLVETRVWPGKWDGQDCLFGLCKDITEEQEAQQRFELLFRNNPALMALSTLPERKFVDVNTTFLSTLGYSKKEVIGKTALELGLFPDAEAMDRTSAILESDGKLHNMELRVRCAGGTLIEGLFSAEVVVMRGQRHLLSVMIDVTALNRATRLLQESESRFLKIAGQVPGVIYQYRLQPDGSSCFPFASEAIREIYGVTPEEVREDASQVFENLHPDDRDGIFASILKSAQDLTPWQHEYRVKFPDGTIRALYGNAMPQREADGSVLWHGFITDITARKQTDEVLRRLVERLSLATKAGQVGIWDWDVVNNHLVWDDNMYRQYGIAPDQFGGAYSAWTAGLHPDDRERGDAEIQMALRGEKDFNTDFRVVWPDGSIHHIRAMALVQRDADGNPLHMIGTNWDITNQERLDNELRASAAYARSLIEANLDPLVTISTSGKITDVNEATVLATGLPRGQLVGADFSDCFTEPDKARASYRKAFTEGFVRDYPLVLLHSSGRTTDVLYNASVYRDTQGNVLGVFAAARDITERKRAEAIVLENVARAEELTRLKSRFVSMASHELRTPLANIMLACELLKNFGGAMPAERSQSVLSGLVDGVTSMVRTLDDLLLAGKLEEGKLPFTPTRLTLLDFLKRCCQEVQPDLKSPSRIEIAFHDAGLGVTADERLLGHVLKNLLENALKYSPAGTRVELGAEAGPDSLTLSVRDCGIGVPEAERKFLFDAFSRASNVGDKPGSGLGLFIAYKCARAHGGQLRYAPQPDGSAFSVTIPIATEFHPVI